MLTLSIIMLDALAKTNEMAKQKNRRGACYERKT